MAKARGMARIHAGLILSSRRRTAAVALLLCVGSLCVVAAGARPFTADPAATSGLSRMVYRRYMAFKGARWETPRPDALQHSTNDCGVAVLAEALRAFRIEPPSYATLARTVRVAARGVTIDALSDGLDSFGIPTTRATYADLAPHRGPLIALLTYRHFVLVRDVDRESVRFFDPLIGEVSLERAAFVSLWKGKGLLLRAPSA